MGILNAVVAFVVELIAIFSFGYIGAYFFTGRPLQIIGAIVSVVAIIFVWALFFSPKASYRLEMPWLFIGKLIILLMPSLMFYLKGDMQWAVSWAVIILVHLVYAASKRVI